MPSQSKELPSAKSSTQLLSDFTDMLDSASHSDVTFLVQGEQIKAHKAILAARSTYFDTMFNAGMKESESNVVEVTDVQPKVFKILLRFLYGSVPEKSECDVWSELLVAADKYDVQHLKEACETSLVKARLFRTL